MHRKIKWLKWFVLAFAMGFFLPRSYSGELFLADTSSYDSYESSDAALVAYHLNVNTIVNLFLENLFKSETIEVSYPPDDSKCGEMGSNLSTYCLAFLLNEEFVQYDIYLASHKNDLNVDERNEDEESDGGPLTIEEALDKATEQRRTFEDQAMLAEQAMDLTLAIYNQVQVIYPVHTELNTMIKNLENYRSNLAKIRDVVSGYPSKFNGASTVQCK